MILKYFSGPGAHFGDPGPHFVDFSDFCDFEDTLAANPPPFRSKCKWITFSHDFQVFSEICDLSHFLSFLIFFVRITKRGPSFRRIPWSL